MHIKDKLNLLEADMRDSHSIERAVEESMPDYIFYLVTGRKMGLHY